jgi:predicted Ser/Thr protein kinase
VTPEYLNQEQKQHLRIGQEDIVEEFENDQMYEGKFGISPREVKQIIYEISNEEKVVTFIEIIDFLKELSDRKAEFDFLNIGAQGDYHNPKKFLYLVEQHCLNEFDSEVRESLGLVDNRSYEEYVEIYVVNINALLKGEKLKNPVTGKFEEPDKYFIKEFENNIHIKENPDSYRSHILSKLGAFALDNPGVEIIYTEVLHEVVKQLKESFRNEQKKIIDKVGTNLVFFLDELENEKENKRIKTGLDDKGRDQILTILKHLDEKFGYSQRGAINCLKYLIKKRYDVAK